MTIAAKRLLLWCLAGIACAGPVWAEDYMSPQLRERVEALQAEVVSQPTNRQNAKERAEVLWDWVNAYALNGGYVPVNLTAMVRPNSMADLNPRFARAIDGYISELSLLDGEPEALGQLSADLGPFVARSWATLQQTYTVGTRPIQRGGGLAVPKHFQTDHPAFQTTDPAGANYVQVTSSNPSAEFVADTVPINGMHGGFRGTQPVLFFRLTSEQLNPGDTITVTYGARSGGGAGLLMPTMSSDAMPFPLYVAFDEDQELFSLPIQPIQVEGAGVAGVRGFAPSVVRPGEKFTLSVRAQDAYYNRATGPLPGWQVLAGDDVVAEFPAGEQVIQTVDLSFAEPGVVRLQIRSSDGSITGGVNPILVSADAQRVFWGDTHGHSGFAEGIGTPDRFMTWAKEDARLDFVTHSEHDIWMDDYEWQVLVDNVSKYSEPGRFIAFLGYEWTTRNMFGGHHNVLFRTPEGRERVPTQFFPVLSELYAGLRARHDPKDVLIIPHAHQASDFRSNDPQLEPLVEIMSQHGTFEWFGRMYLSRGHQVGFTAASDNHLSQPGYTAPKGGGLSQRGGLGAVLADEVEVDALFDAMKNLRAYATTGERIILDVSLNGTGMGQRIPFAEDRALSGYVVGSAPIAEIAVVKNDEVIWQEDYLTQMDGRFSKDEETFYVSFSSQSVPMHRGDNPRGWRPWRGTLRVEGAELVAATPTDFVSSDQAFEVDTETGEVQFRTVSRGDTSSIRLTLKGVSRRTKVALEFEAAREFGSGPPIFRRPAAIPEAELKLAVADLERGQTQATLPLDIYQDTVTLRRVLTDGPMERRFEIQDNGQIQGDYYYVRVTQADDAMAWSSPIWVGGYPKR